MVKAAITYEVLIPQTSLIAFEKVQKLGTEESEFVKIPLYFAQPPVPKVPEHAAFREGCGSG